MKLLRKNQKGFLHVEIVAVVAVLVVVGTVGFLVAHHSTKKPPKPTVITSTSKVTPKPKTTSSTPKATTSSPLTVSTPGSSSTSSNSGAPSTKSTESSSNSSSGGSSNSSGSSGSSSPPPSNPNPTTASITISSDGCYVTAISPVDASVGISEYSSDDANGYSYPLTANQSSTISTGANQGDNIVATIGDYDGNQLAYQKSVVTSSSCPPAGQQ